MGWVSKFNTDYWDAGLYASWTGSEWDDTGPGWFILTVKGAWAAGYRPTKIRLYGTALNDTNNLREGDNTSIAVGDHASGEYHELDCTYDSADEIDDIHSLVCAGTVPLTDLQFYEEPTGWAHKFMGVATASISKILGTARASVAKVIGI